MNPATLAAAFVLVTSQGVIWRPVTGVDLLQPEEIIYLHSLGASPYNTALKPSPERCHQRNGREISFSLSCASERERGFNSTL